MEGYGPSTYGDGMAAVYDDWYATRGDVDGTVAFVAALARAAGSGPVLELGIGTGRLAAPLAAAGIEVWGIDASAAMVERLRTKPGCATIPVAVGDMAALDLAGLPGGDTARFAVVLAADNTLFNLTTADAQQRCLQRCCAVLAADGRLVVEAFVPALDAPPRSVDVRTIDAERVVLSVTEHDAAAQTIAGQYVEIRESGNRLRPWMVRYALPAELDEMARAAGLVLVERWADWRRRPFGPDDAQHVSVYAAAR